MLKKALVILALALLTTGTAMAQIVIFEETFGPATGAAAPLPAGWTVIDGDGQPVNASVAWVTEAWMVNDNFDDANDAVAWSTSWYDPAGASDDWAITPQIAVTANNALTWEAKAQDPSYPDGYEVRISTTTPDVAGMTTTLFSVASEVAAWTPHTVDLSAYSGQSVYIGFRNISNDQFLLGIDDIRVTDPVPVELMSFTVN